MRCSASDLRFRCSDYSNSSRITGAARVAHNKLNGLALLANLLTGDCLKNLLNRSDCEVYSVNPHLVWTEIQCEEAKPDVKNWT